MCMYMYIYIYIYIISIYIYIISIYIYREREICEGGPLQARRDLEHLTVRNSGAMLAATTGIIAYSLYLRMGNQPQTNAK